MFLKALPFLIIYSILVNLINLIGPLTGGIIEGLLELFVIPILTINFLNKETVSSYFEFKKVKYVFNNLGDYLIAILKSIGLAIIFILMIIILVGIPASIFTENIFLADFYRRRVK